MKIQVKAGEHARTLAPVSVTVPKSALEGTTRAVDSVTGVAIPTQKASEDGDHATLIFLADGLAAREERTYDLVSAPTPERVSLKQEDSSIAVSISGKPFATYLYGGGHYRPHFYPVLGPNGKEVTETGASDHKHHRSLYVAYGEVNGADCWSEGSGAGRVELKTLKEVVSGSVYGQIAAESVWKTKEGQPLMTEETTWRIYGLPEQRRLIEATIRFTASEGEVHFGDTKEGGILSVRVAASLRVSETGKIENSFGGVNESETWGKRANWCDYSGYVEGTHLGIAVLDHTTNPRHPCHWHVRNYGLMTTNVFGRGTFEKGGVLLDGDGQYVLKAGESLTFRYQAVVHAGDAHDADLAGAYHNFVNPPKASVSA